MGWKKGEAKERVGKGRGKEGRREESSVLHVGRLLLLFSCSVVSDSLVTTWTIAHQAPWSMGFSRQESWSKLPFPPPGDLPNPGIKPASPATPALVSLFLTSELPELSIGSLSSV